MRCADERAALDAFCERVRADDPDVLTGWNTIDFDLTVLQRIAARLAPSAAPRPRRRRAAAAQGRGLLRQRPGDDPGPRRARRHRPAARRVRAHGRLLARRGRTRGARRRQGASPATLAIAIARDPAQLRARPRGVRAIRAHRRAARVSNRREAQPRAARVRAQPLDRHDARPRRGEHRVVRLPVSLASSSGAASSRRPCATTTRACYAAQQGGHVLEPAPGLHANVWVFDFKSLYPSLIRTFNIDPLGYVPSPRARRRLDRSAGRRVPARARDLAAHARRAVPAPRGREEARRRRRVASDQDPDELVLWRARHARVPVLQPRARERDHRTRARDAALVEGAGSKPRATRCSTATRTACSCARVATIRTSHARRRAASSPSSTPSSQRTSRTRWRRGEPARASVREAVLKLFLPHARGSARGASKRYAGLVHAPRGGGEVAADDLEFVGLEVVRRDWTALAKRVQRELYRRLFTDERVDAYLADVVRRLRAGELDDELVYRKNLRKSADDYTASTPPHVRPRASRRSRTGRLISYVMTTAGPEPLDNRAAPARPRALRRQAGAARRGAGARRAAPRLRARDRRRAPGRLVLMGARGALGRGTRGNRSSAPLTGRHFPLGRTRCLSSSPKFCTTTMLAGAAARFSSPRQNHQKPPVARDVIAASTRGLERWTYGPENSGFGVRERELVAGLDGHGHHASP